MTDETSEQVGVLKEILKWIKFMGMKEAKDVLTATLSDDVKKIVYHHSDGSKGTQDFKSIANIKSTATISRYWKEWYALGIVEMVPVKGGERARRIFNLEDFGVVIPELPTKIMTSESPKVEFEGVDADAGQKQ